MMEIMDLRLPIFEWVQVITSTSDGVLIRYNNTVFIYFLNTVGAHQIIHNDMNFLCNTQIQHILSFIIVVVVIDNMIVLIIILLLRVE